jgi:hypothetical protein
LKIFFLFLGLFTADQKLKGKTNIYTRQNPNGARSGYECPEERDYYPYWHPTDWTDIVVFAHNEAICQYYQRESFNVNPKGKSPWTRLLGHLVCTVFYWQGSQD